MTHTPSPFTALTDDHLLAEVRRLAAIERVATAQLIAALMEVDARRLYLGQGCSSLFTYCTQILHLSEHAAYGRIAAARAARRFPVILPLLAEGAVTLTTVGLLAPHLTPDNCAGLLAAARHASKRDVEHRIASLRPQPAVPSTIRKLPTRAPAPSSVPELLVERPMQAAASGPARPAREFLLHASIGTGAEPAKLTERPLVDRLSGHRTAPQHRRDTAHAASRGEMPERQLRDDEPFM